jgi:exodeoxyribonuclease VII large subunit
MTAKSADICKLSEIQNEIREVLQGNFQMPRWVVAEISELKENFSGHCYLDLVEKDEASDRLVARARATIWSGTYRMLKPYFETSTGYELGPGIKIMVSATIEYHPVYGLSLNIRDIDPSYTLGDVERRRQEIIRQLEKEGVLEMNRDTVLPVVPQKIAVISSETAAGFGDFMEQLTHNPFGYKFYTRLYPSVMQGEKAEASIIGSLEKIFEKVDLYDAVVLIRGGGSKSDLASFDQYELAYHVAQFPIPVITGIGHEQDDTIVDLVAHTRLKTPTAVAEFLIDRAAGFEAALDEYGTILVNSIRQILNEHRLQLQVLRQKLISAYREYTSGKMAELLKTSSGTRHAIQLSISRHSRRLLEIRENLKNDARNIPERKKLETAFIMRRLPQVVHNLLDREKKRLDHYRKLTSYAEPSQILKLGFSVTRHGGKALKNVESLAEGDQLETELHEGKVSSRVINLGKKLYIRTSKEDSG